jgi:hypothetical protein
MDAFLPTDDTKYTQCKHWPMKGVNSVVNSGCAYLIMAEICSRCLIHSVSIQKFSDGKKYILVATFRGNQTTDNHIPDGYKLKKKDCADLTQF